MTVNELNILKNSVLDGTEAYVDIRLETLAYSKTEIGIITEKTDTGGKTLHTVKVGTDSRYRLYTNVLSNGNISYPLNAVVFLLVPNAQHSNSFILGQLDTSPCNILGGKIYIGKIGSSNNYYFNVNDSGELTIKDSSAKTLVTLNGTNGLTMTKGSINLGTATQTKSRITIDNNGNIYCRNNSGDSVFQVVNGVVTIGNYAKSSDLDAYTTKDGLAESNYTIINGGNITTGTIKSANASSGGDEKYTTAGMKINLSDGWLSAPKFYLASDGTASFKGSITGATGKIGGFNIGDSNLSIGDAILSRYNIGCGTSGNGMVVLHSENTTGSESNAYIQISNAGTPTTCLAGIRIYRNGKVELWEGDTPQTARVKWEKYLSNIP